MRAGGWRCHSDVIMVRNEPRWQGAGDVTHRKRVEVCVRIWREKGSGTRRQTRRIDFWSSQVRGERAPYGGRTRLGPNEWDGIENCVSPPYVETVNSKLIKRFRTWTRSRYVFPNFEIYMLYRDQHSMSISPIPHMAIFVYMATQHRHIWCQNLGISFMIWFTTGLLWFHGDDQRSG